MSEINAYIEQFPESTRILLKQVRATIRSVVPDAEEAMRYAMPTFRVNKKNLVHFAGYKEHIGFYPTPSGIQAFEDEFKSKGYQWSKGAVQFPIDQPMPLDLIRRITEFRLEEVR